MPGEQSLQNQIQGPKLPPRHRAWLVDLDGTLYRASGVRLAMALELACGHWRAMSMLRVFRKEHECLRQELVEEVDCPYTLQIERTARRLNCSPDTMRLLVTEWMHQRPGKWIRLFRRQRLLTEIQQFRNTGGVTALVSDYPASAKLAALGISSLFDAIVASGEPDGPRRLKPWPDGYVLAAHRLDVEPASCLVLGDRPDADGQAAARAGMDFRRVSG